MTDSPIDHVGENRSHWDSRAHEWVAAGERAWAAQEPSWGNWGVPENELNMLPADMTGLDAVELGCGTGYVSAWMARRGATVVGIDNSERQLATARRLAAEHGIALTLLHGNAEKVDYADGTFDFAISEYGAAIWCDPYKWIPEAHRLLKPGGALTFLGSTPLAMICTPKNGANYDTSLHWDYFGMRRFDWRHVEIDPGGVEFNLPVSEWMRLFRRTGFDVLDYHELRAPDAASGVMFAAPSDWSKRWPAEHVWKLRKRR